MMLVDVGKVNVNDPVEKYLPEFKNLWLASEQDKKHIVLTRPKRPITVRDILSHTSGMPFMSAMEQPTFDLLPLRESVLSYAMTPLQSEPGTKYQYSNAGINTAGRIIEVVSGVPYAEFLEKRLFQPLGMKDTTFWPTKRQLKRLAKSYKINPDKTDLKEVNIEQLEYPLNDPKRQPIPAGGLFSSAHDLERFCRMILNGGVFEGKRYLSENAVKQMTSKQTGKAISDGYGFGWQTNGESFGHGGAYSTNMDINTKTGLITIFLVQVTGNVEGCYKALGDFRKAAAKEFAVSR